MNNYAYDPWKNSSSAAPEIEEAPKHKKPKLEVRVNEKVVNRSGVQGYIKFIVYGAIAVFCCFLVLGGLIRCNELDIQIGKATKELSELQSEHARLTAVIEEKQSREIIEDYAVNVLGMQPVQDYQKSTIKIERKDTLISLEKEKDRTSLTDFISEMFS